MQTNLEHKDWKGSTGGTRWMQVSLVKILASIDQRVLYSVVALFVAPLYMIIHHKEYLSQYHFFRQRFGESWYKAFWHTYVNHYRFGQVIVDRFAVFGGKKFKLEIAEMAMWRELENQEEGFVQISSHIGNYEMAGYLLKAKNKMFNALVFHGETETMMNNRGRVFTNNNIRMVPVSPDMSHIFTLNNALADGEIVSMPGDRIFGSQKSLAIPFLGEVAKFPLGPFQLAAARGCKMVAVFCMKKDWQTYEVTIKVIEGEKAKDLGQKFVSELESVVRQYPTQWFNYFDFWK